VSRLARLDPRIDKPVTGETEPASSERLVAEISRDDAELIRRQDRDGKAYSGMGAKNGWTGRAPILFPTGGRRPK
jgi:hypothetical protein